jgi:nucleoside-diphosphate-sugar epimerase
VLALRATGHDAVGLDTFYYRGCDFGHGPEFEPLLELDVRDVRRRLEGFDAVAHLAALSNGPLGDFNRNWTYSIK